MTKNYIEAQLRLIHNLAEQAVDVSHDLFYELTTETTDQDAMIDQLNRLNGGEVEGIDEFIRDFINEYAPKNMPEGEPVQGTTIRVTSPKCIELRAPTGKGELLSYVYPSDGETMCCGVSYFEKTTESEIDLCVAEVKKGVLAETNGKPADNEDIDIYVYGSPYCEDWSDMKTVKYTEIVDALSEEDADDE